MATEKSFECEAFGFSYTLKRKKVKNINLRVDSHGKVSVSAPFTVPIFVIRRFVEAHGEKIAKAVESILEKRGTSEEPRWRYDKDIEERFLKEAEKVCRLIETLFFEGDYSSPKIELCRGESRWGYYMPRRNIIRLNIRLCEYPTECLLYVAMHEYCHILVPNHSERFYSELEKRMPEWRALKAKLKSFSRQ